MSSERYGGDSESEDDNFNPAPEAGSDDEDNNQVKADNDAPSSSAQDGHHDDNDDDEEEEDARPSNTGRVASKAPVNLSRDDDEDDEEEEEGDVKNDDDEEEDEDEEDEEDEDDVHEGHRRKRSRKHQSAAFFDIEAEVDDEDEDEADEKDDEEIENFIDNAHPDDMIESGRLDDDRRHRELDRRREMEKSLDAEKLAESLRQRYGNRRTNKGFGDSTVVPKRLLMPSVEDPSIWGVRCKEGKEREVVFSIMKRIEERMGTQQQLGITAAFERGGMESAMKGYVYVEAFRQNDVMIALDGMLNVYPRSKMVLVEIKEMPSLLHITQTASLNVGDWVRLRRPAKHAGDLAQVLDVTENGLEARVRFIPRIDYSIAEKGADGKRKRPGTVRPPQRLFNEAEARKRGSRQIMGNGQPNAWTYNGDDFENGFQVKDIKIQFLQTKDVVPSLEEVARFATEGEDGATSLDLKALSASLKTSNKNVTYVSGDVIEVYEGEQKGVVGKAINVQGDIVTLQVTEGELAGQTIDVPNKGLRKRFKTGDHVKVIGGSRYRDEVGMVVKIAEDRVTLLTDQTSTEVTVFSKDLREADDIGGQGSLGQYALLDLVQLDATTVGCIVKVDRESLVVLDQNGETRQIMPSQITNVLPKRKTAVAADRNGSEIRLDDVVREHGGQKRQGKIIHIHRSFVYLHSHDSRENAGVFVTRASNVETVAAKGGRINAPAGPNLDAMNPSMMRNPKGQMGPPKQFGRDKTLGMTCTIRKGGYKGLLGIVKDASDTHCRVELHTKSKIVSVPKTDLVFKDKITGRVIDINARGGYGGGGRGGGAAGSGGGGGFGGGYGAPSGWQQSGSRTPAVGGAMGARTPAWGASKPASSYTPAWNRGPDNSGSRTPAPAWGDGSRTVNPYGDGNRTAYGGATSYGGSTAYGGSAWNSGSKTPAPNSYGMGSRTPAVPGGHGTSSSDAWGSGSKTPAPYGASAPTPGASGNDSWGGYNSGTNGSSSEAYGAPTPGAGLSAPTPAALNAPTPGGYPSAPTPAAISAPTPAAAWAGGWGADTAPTPAASAPTPGAYYGAPTPAAYGAPETPAPGPRYDDED